MAEQHQLNQDELNRVLDDEELELVIGGVDSMGAFQAMSDEQILTTLGSSGIATLSASGKYRLF